MMAEKIVLITGATSGIGKAAALGLAKHDVRVVIMARDKIAGERTVREIKEASENPNVELLVCDLSGQASIRSAADEFKRRYEHLNVLINNAAVFAGKQVFTEDGLERMFATNYLGPFLLTSLLSEMLEAGNPARVINVTAPSTIKPNFDDLQGKKKFSSVNAFGASKAGNLLFTFALSRRLKDSGVTVNAYHPGIVRTHLMQQAPFLMNIMSRLLNLFVGVSPEKAAGGLVELATSGKFENTTGQLIHKGKPIKAPFQDDTVTQERLWEESVKLIKQR